MVTVDFTLASSVYYLPGYDSAELDLTETLAYKYGSNINPWSHNVDIVYRDTNVQPTFVSINSDNSKATFDTRDDVLADISSVLDL